MPTAFPIPELLAPAGSLDKLKTAVLYGADAVYLGAPDVSLRAHAVLSREDLAAGIAHAHAHGVKAYVTANIFARNADLADFPEVLRFLRAAGADGMIVADPGLFRLARQHAPDLPLHVSTQANVTNAASVQFWQEQGARRVNLARELSIAEIAAIRRQVGIELEVFVHGALCISYSGRCALSLYLTGRDANRGDCAHPCRYSYGLVEEKRPGQFFPVEEDDRGSYIFNSRDLCLVNRLPELILAGAGSLKLEGRMKSVYAVGAMVRAYRAALDHLAGVMAQQGRDALDGMPMPPRFAEELARVGSRGMTENFASGPPDRAGMLYEGTRIIPSHVPIGVVRQAGPRPLIEVRNPFRTGMRAEYLGRGMRDWEVGIAGMLDAAGLPIDRANPGQIVTLLTEPEIPAWEEHGLLRMRAGDSLAR